VKSTPCTCKHQSNNLGLVSLTRLRPSLHRNFWRMNKRNIIQKYHVLSRFEIRPYNWLMTIHECASRRPFIHSSTLSVQQNKCIGGNEHLHNPQSHCRMDLLEMSYFVKQHSWRARRHPRNQASQMTLSSPWMGPVRPGLR
jgi:hypothetical protein